MTPDELYRIVSDDPAYRRISTIRTEVMTTLKRVSQIVLLVMLLFPSVAAAQLLVYNEDAVLAGVDRIEFTDVFVIWDDRITQKSRSQFESELRDAFELGVRRMGIVIDSTLESWGRTAGCTVNILYLDVGSVVVAQQVSYRDILIRRYTAGQQEAEVWSRSRIGTVGESELDGRAFGEQCAGVLEFYWRTANPGK